MVKAVVDVERRVMAVGGELHSDEEAALQANLWGINLYPAEAGDAWIEFDAMINVRPAQGNRAAPPVRPVRQPVNFGPPPP